MLLLRRSSLFAQRARLLSSQSDAISRTVLQLSERHAGSAASSSFASLETKFKVRAN